MKIFLPLVAGVVILTACDSAMLGTPAVDANTDSTDTTADNNSGNNVDTDIDGADSVGNTSTTLTIQEGSSGQGYCGANGVVEKDHEGFSGEGYVNTDNRTGVSIRWNVSVPESNNYDVTVRYANGSGAARSAEFVVDGNPGTTTVYAFPADGGWDNWHQETQSVVLLAGSNSLELIAAASGGLPNVDSISIAGQSVAVNSCADDMNTGENTVEESTDNNSSEGSTDEPSETQEPAEESTGDTTSTETTTDGSSGDTTSEETTTGESSGDTTSEETVTDGSSGDTTPAETPTGGSSGGTAPDALVGWASDSSCGSNGTTGGGSGAPDVTVTSASDLKSQLTSNGAKVIAIEGTISGVGAINDVTDKTLVGRNGAVISGGIRFNDARNVIVKNIEFADGSNDTFELSSSECIWFDHNIFRDGRDGNLDIVRASNYITVSWNRFYYTRSHDHMLSNLNGNQNNRPSDEGKIKVTFHHNWWGAGVKERMPRTRYGDIHVFNNYYKYEPVSGDSGQSYVIGAGQYARLLIENNYFDGSNDPIRFFSDEGTAEVVHRGNAFVNTNGQHVERGASFVPPYYYNLDEALDVPSLVRAGAGPQ